MTVVVCLLLAAAVLCWPPRIGAGIDSPNTVDEGSPDGLKQRGQPWFRHLAQRWSGRAAAQEESDLLNLTDGIAAALEAGLTPAAALESAARGLSIASSDDDAPTGRLRRALPGLLLRARTGDGLGAAWHELAQESGLSELKIIARSWSLSESTGAPLAHAARTAARLVREERDQRRRAATAVAGAHATMTILTLLPLGGPLLAAVMGIDLMELYASSPLVWACLGLGLGLVAVGRWWVRRLVVNALRGPVLT